MSLRRAVRGLGLAVGLGLASPAASQSAGVAAPCQRGDLPAGASDVCVSVAQALTSVQPQLGMLLAGGNPTLGSASTAGMRFGIAPGTSATAKVNFVPIRLPDVLDRDASGSGLPTERTIPAPAVSAALSVSLLRGGELTPTLGGIGALDLLGSVTWLPLRALDISSFRLESDEFAYGVGARLGLLRESFTVPGASVSFMYRRFREVGYGSVCRAPLAVGAGGGEGYRFASGVCATEGDPGEFVLDLTDLSGRGVVGKQRGRLGLAAGVGFDRFDSDAGFGFRAPAGGEAGVAGYVARAAGLEVVNERWSAFGSASFTNLVSTFSLEAGWMQGGEALAGYPAGNDFDPGRGVLFGSIGVRLSF